MMADINIGPEAGGVPGGASSAVRIPVLPTVSTPLRDAPPISRWRGAGIPETVPVQTQDIFEGIENAGEKIGQILSAQGKNQRALQLNQLSGDFDNTDKLTRVTSAANGSYDAADPNNMTSLYKQGMGDAAAKILKDPANQALLADPIYGPQLTQRLNQTQNQGFVEMTSHMLGVAHDDHELKLQDQMKNGAVAIGSDYLVGPDGKVVDGPDALKKTQETVSLIHDMKGHLPGEEAADMQALSLHIASERAQAIAQNIQQPFLLDKFIKQQPPGTFTPDQLSHFQEVQAVRDQGTYNDALAHNDAKVGDVLAHLNKMQDAHDPNLAAEAYKAEPLIGSEKTKSYVGASYRPPAMPSEAGLVEGYVKGMRCRPVSVFEPGHQCDRPDEDQRPRQAGAARHLHDLQEGKKPLGAAKITSRRQVRDALTPPMGGELFPAQKQKIDDGLNDYDNAISEAHTVQEVNDIRDNVIKIYGGAPAPAPKYVVDPKKVAPTLTAGQIAAGARKARESGFIPTPGPVSPMSAAPAPKAVATPVAAEGGVSNAGTGTHTKPECRRERRRYVSRAHPVSERRIVGRGVLCGASRRGQGRRRQSAGATGRTGARSYADAAERTPTGHTSARRNHRGDRRHHGRIDGGRQRCAGPRQAAGSGVATAAITTGGADGRAGVAAAAGHRSDVCARRWRCGWRRRRRDGRGQGCGEDRAHF